MFHLTSLTLFNFLPLCPWHKERDAQMHVIDLQMQLLCVLIKLYNKYVYDVATKVFMK
jgi:hypothetical protein